MIPLIEPISLSNDTLIVFYGWGGFGKGSLVPQSEQEYPDKDILGRVWSTLGPVSILGDTYSAGGAWRTERVEAMYGSPLEYIEEKERLFRALVGTSQLTEYTSAVILRTFRQEVKDVRPDKGGIIVGTCFFIYKPQPPRGGGEDLPVAA